MSRVTFVAKQGTPYEDGWPEKLVGDGFIDLRLVDVGNDDCATYEDNFHGGYEFFCRDDREWTAEVREDG
jgi:hypothetical protein